MSSFDYIVIGSGSGGLASARRAASHGAKVALIEQSSIGGTCVNRGCVPKKIMFHAAELADSLRLFPHYGFGSTGLRPLAPRLLAGEIESQLEASSTLAAHEKSAPQSLLSPEGKTKRKKPSKIRIPDGSNLISHAVTPLQRHLLVDPGLETQVRFEWSALKQARDEYIRRIHGIYTSALQQEGVQYYPDESGSILVQEKKVKLGKSGQVLTAPHILLATGASPSIPKEIPGIELAISSDEFFLLDKQPKRVGIIGGGYIAVELAGILHALGSQVHLWHRADQLLRHGPFDPLMGDLVYEEMVQNGILIQSSTVVTKLEYSDPEMEDDMFDAPVKRVSTNSTSSESEPASPVEQPGSCPIRVTLDMKHGDKQRQALVVVDVVIVATGRRPNLEGVCDSLKCNEKGLIAINDRQETNLDGVYAVGDITTQAHLTPVAIAAGRALADRLFGKNMGSKKVDLTIVPSVVFSHPPIGSVGLTEEGAKKKYGKDLVAVYVKKFTSLYYGVVPPGHRDRHLSAFKIITTKENEKEKVVGLHLFGKNVDEILQGFAVAMEAGLTKEALDRAIPIHPTAAEELIGMK